MPSAENLNMSVIVLLTGLVVVFAALIVLTFIIKGYGAAVTAVLNGKKKNAAEKAAAKPAPAPKAASAVKAAPAAPSVPAVSDGIPGEVIAAIAAAVDYTLSLIHISIAGKGGTVKFFSYQKKHGFGVIKGAEQ